MELKKKVKEWGKGVLCKKKYRKKRRLLFRGSERNRKINVGGGN